MIKIFHLLFLFFLLIFSGKYVFGDNSIQIVSRQEWGAIDEYMYLDSKQWIDILNKETKIQVDKGEYKGEELLIKYLQKPDYNEKIEEYLELFFSQKRKISHTITQKDGRELFWPIAHSQKISGIIVHHTAWDYTDPYESIREIYKFHTLNRKWGDTGYNFLIAADGTIFEGRAGGETAVGAHTKRNNIGNIGISLMGDYNHENIPQKQLESLEKLMIYLIEKYHIDITKKKYFHEDCLEYECEHDIESELLLPLIAHRDSSTSTCPGEEGYKDFLELRDKIIHQYKIKNLNIQKFHKIFDKYSHEKLEYLYHKLVVKKQSENNFKRKMIYTQILGILKDYIHEKYN